MFSLWGNSCKKKDPKKVLKVRLCIGQHNLNEINFPRSSKDSKNLEKNNKTTPSIFCFYKVMVRQTYISKHNSECKNQVILVMITDGKNGIILLWTACLDYLHGVTLNHNDDHYWKTCLQSFRTEGKLK